MFEEERVLNNLSSKVNDLLYRYEELVRKNEDLNNEIIILKAENESKNIKIASLEEEINKKNNESEDLMRRIELVLK